MTGILTLAIEMSNPSCEAGVAIGSHAGTLGVETIHAGDGRHDDLMTAIDRLAKRLAISPRDLSRIAVSIGPGGYTALRIAIATTKMLCETLGAECFAIPTARIIARRAAAPAPFAVILASKDETAFATVFASRDEHDQGRLIDASHLAELKIKTIIADGFLPKAISAGATTLHIPILAPRFDPGACLELSFESAAINPLALAPCYPREPEAVTKWRLRRGQ